MSSRSLATARSKRAGENAPPVSGNRPITSIGSQAAFAQQPQQMHPGMRTNNSQPRVAATRPPPPPQQQSLNRGNLQNKKQPTQNYYEEEEHPINAFPKLSIPTAIGLITIRLTKVEQWIMENHHELAIGANSEQNVTNLSENQKIIDISVLNSIVQRIDSIEKYNLNNPSKSLVNLDELKDNVKLLTEQIKRIGDDVSKHTIELSKHNESIFKFNRELVETKDILKSFMIKYDTFVEQTGENFKDYELALGDLESKIFPDNGEIETTSNLDQAISNDVPIDVPIDVSTIGVIEI
jgi:hypothetical protein